MEFIRDFYNLKPEHRNCVATIGNFDGVHKGHQQLIAKLIHKAEALNLPATVILFEPHPMEYFLQKKAAARLMRLREKLAVLNVLGVDRVLCLRFNEKLAQLAATEFIEQVLIDGLGVKSIIVGDDFHFGHQRKGDIALLRLYGQQFDFEVEATETFYIDNKRVSSSWVRKALADADLDLAEQLCGRRFSMSGRVAHGDKRGRILGFPTANLYLHRNVVPLAGIYSVLIHGLSSDPLTGVADVGNRPTIDGDGRTLLEVHIFDFNQVIYGRYINVEFVHKQRDEEKYASLEELRQQILKDAEEARQYFRDKF